MKTWATALPALALAALLALPAGLEAQTTSAFSVTVRGGGAFPTSDFGEDVAETGWGLGGDVEFAFHPRVAAYGGYNWFSFDPEDDGDDVKSTGWNAGLKLILFPRDGLLPWARGGLIYMETETNGFESGSELGYEAAIGVDWPMGDVLTFVPMVRYQQYQIDAPTGVPGTTEDFDIGYLTLEAGLKLNFGSIGF